MTDREKAIVMAYTGTCMLAGDKLGIYYQYIQEKLGHCVMTHELAYPEVQDAIKEAAKDDFIGLCRCDEPRVMTYDELATFDGAFLIESSATSPLDWVYFLDTDTKSDAVWLEDFDWERYFVYREDYGTYMRCWTSRPTEEQRKVVPWDD